MVQKCSEQQTLVCDCMCALDGNFEKAIMIYKQKATGAIENTKSAYYCFPFAALAHAWTKK